MSFAKSNLTQAVKRFLRLLGAPAWVTFLLSVATIIFGSKWGFVFVSAFSGQLALTLIKLFFFLAFGLTALAHVFRAGGKLSSLLFWSGRSLAEVAFDSSAAAFGVFLGLSPALIYENGLVDGGTLTFHILLLFGSIAGLSWFAVAAQQIIGPLPTFWHQLGFRALALILAVNSFLALYCEPWKEVDSVTFRPNEQVCACMKWPEYITFRANPATGTSHSINSYRQ